MAALPLIVFWCQRDASRSWNDGTDLSAHRGGLGGSAESSALATTFWRSALGHRLSATTLTTLPIILSPDTRRGP